jgi:hypothetical protein
MDLNDETLPTSIKKKASKKGRERERVYSPKIDVGQGPSPGKQNSSKERWATRRKGNH